MIGLPRGVRLEPHRDEPLKHEIQGFPQPKQLWVPLVEMCIRDRFYLDRFLTNEMTEEFLGDNRPKRGENRSFEQTKLKYPLFSLDTLHPVW